MKGRGETERGKPIMDLGESMCTCGMQDSNWHVIGECQEMSAIKRREARSRAILGYIRGFETAEGKKLVTTVMAALEEVFGVSKDGQVLNKTKKNWAGKPVLRHVTTLVRDGGIRAAWCAIWHRSLLL